MGFCGWPCLTYHNYLKEHCLLKELKIFVSEHMNTTNNRVYLLVTNLVESFAAEKYSGPSIEIFKSENARLKILNEY